MAIANITQSAVLDSFSGIIYLFCNSLSYYLSQIRSSATMLLSVLEIQDGDRFLHIKSC